MANRETQVPLEIVSGGSPKVRATQTPMEFVSAGSPKVRATQLAIEIVVPNVPNQSPPVGPLIPIQEFVLS